MNTNLINHKEKKATTSELFTPNLSASMKNDEIDLKEIVKTLWQNKKKVLISISICTLLASAYAFTAKEWWTSHAIVTKAITSQLSPILQQSKQVEPVFNNDELINIYDAAQLQNEFIETFNSPANKTSFIVANISLFPQKEGEKIDDRFIDDWTDKISHHFDKKTNFHHLKIQTENPLLSKDLLLRYISYTNDAVLNSVYQNLKASVQYKKLEIQQKIDIKYSELKNKLAQEIERTKISYQIAKDAKINRPLENVNQSGVFHIQLGSEALEQKIKALENVKNLSVLEVDENLNMYDAQLSVLESVISPFAGAKVFNYIDKPSQPMKRDKPKRTLIIILGALLGTMLGVAIVLLRKAFENNN